MATTIDINRQTVLSAKIDITYADGYTSGTAFPVIYLRPGTRILRGWIDVTEAWNTGTTSTIDIGDTEGTDDTDRYTSSPINLKATGLTALTAPVSDGIIEATGALTALITDSGTTPTAGAARIYIEYVEENRFVEFNAYRG